MKNVNLHEKISRDFCPVWGGHTTYNNKSNNTNSTNLFSARDTGHWTQFNDEPQKLKILKHQHQHELL